MSCQVSRVWRHAHQRKNRQKHRHGPRTQTTRPGVHKLVIETNSPAVPHALTEVKPIVVSSSKRLTMSVRAQTVREPQKTQVEIHNSYHAHPQINCERSEKRKVEILHLLLSYEHEQSETCVRPAQREIDYLRTCFVGHEIDGDVCFSFQDVSYNTIPRARWGIFGTVVSIANKIYQWFKLKFCLNVAKHVDCQSITAISGKILRIISVLFAL